MRFSSYMHAGEGGAAQLSTVTYLVNAGDFKLLVIAYDVGIMIGFLVNGMVEVG